MTCLFLEGDSHDNSAPSFIQGRQALWKFVNTYFLRKGGVLFFFQKEKNLTPGVFPPADTHRESGEETTEAAFSPVLAFLKGRNA